MGPIRMNICDCYVGEDWNIGFTPAEWLSVVDMTGWNLAFNIGSTDGASDILNATDTNGLIIFTDQVQGIGYVRVPATTTSLIAPGNYFFEFRRTTSGNNKVLTKGRFAVRG